MLRSIEDSSRSATTRRVVAHVSGTLRAHADDVAAGLTEREVWRMVAAGASNADIAAALHLSAGTVKTHVCLPDRSV